MFIALILAPIVLMLIWYEIKRHPKRVVVALVAACVFTAWWMSLDAANHPLDHGGHDVLNSQAN